MAVPRTPSEREFTIARILRPLGSRPMSKSQAKRAAQLLGVHWTTVYRLRQRFLADPVASAVARRRRGPPPGEPRLDGRVEGIIDQVLSRWLPRHKQLAHPALDLTVEIHRRCRRSGLPSPSRSTVLRRWEQHRQREAVRLADDPSARIAPGHLIAEEPGSW